MSNYLFRYFAIFIIGCFPFISHCQTLTFFDIDTSAYPRLKAKFYALDANSNQVLDLTKEDVSIKENGIPQTVVKVTNPQIKDPIPLSVVLTVDISGSMKGQNLNIAKVAANDFISVFPLYNSECAITTFDNGNYVNCDFTRDKQRLVSAIENLTPRGGTDYNAAFIKPTTGGLEIAKGGSNKKVLIFLTDGLGNANESQILTKAISEGVIVFCITIAMPAPEVLKNIATKTGGLYFENVTTPSDASQIYQYILKLSHNSSPSTVEWLSNSCQLGRGVEFSVPGKNYKSATKGYQAPMKGIKKLIAKPSAVNFINLKPGSIKDTIITLISKFSDQTILSAVSSNGTFTLVNLKFPLLLKADKEFKVTIRYAAKDTSFQSGKIEFRTDYCSPLVVQVNSGRQGKINRIPIKVEHPNGKEVFYAGSDTVITWTGVTGSDKVQLKFSKDNGKSWEPISSAADNNKFHWKVPMITGDQMLVKAVLNGPIGKQTSSQTKIVCPKLDLESYTNTVISPDNTKIMGSIYAKGGGVHLVDFSTGQTLHVFSNKTWSDKYLFSPDGSQIYFYNTSPPEVYDINTFEKIQGLTLPPYDAVYNGDKSLYGYTQNEHKVLIKEVETHNLIATLDVPDVYLHNKDLEFTKNYVFHQKKESIQIWDLKNNLQLDVIKNPELISDFKINSTEEYLVVLSVARNVYIYDLNTRMLLHTINGSGGLYEAFDVFDNWLLSTSAGMPALYDLQTGKLIKIINEEKIERQITSKAKFTSDGSMVLVTAKQKADAAVNAQARHTLYPTGKTAINSNLGEDVSDMTFSIIKPHISSKNISIGKIVVGETKDSVITEFISNKNRTKITINEIKFRGADASSFSIISGTAPFTIPENGIGKVEFQFKPSKAGVHTTNVIIVSAFDTLMQTLTGEGIDNIVQLQSELINVGKVNVGSSKDHDAVGVIKNTGTSKITIIGFENAGPDKNQFYFPTTTGFTLKPGEAKDIKILFSPVKRGRTTTTLSFKIKGIPGTVNVQVFGEGVAPKEYILIGTLMNEKSKDPLEGIVECVDSLTNKTIASIKTNPKGSFSFKIFPDRIYKIIATKEGFGSSKNRIDLTQVLLIDTIQKDLFLTPSPNSMENGKVVIFGKVLDKVSRKPLQANISYKVLKSQGHGHTIQSDKEGNYRIEVSYGDAYELLTEKKDHMSDNSSVDARLIAEYKEIHLDILLPPLEVGNTIGLHNVFFERGKSVLLEPSYSELDLLVKILKENPTLKIELSGHTDNVGDPEKNLKLSEERVDVIKKYLVENGIGEKRLTGKGYGGTKPVASNAEEETRKLNRRVEFTIVGK